MPSVLFLVAAGFEPMEIVEPADIIKRCDIEVTFAAVGTDSLFVKGAPDYVMKCDTFFKTVRYTDYDAIVVPGGVPGTDNLANDDGVVNKIREMYNQGRKIFSICAAPAYVLAAKAKILDGKNAIGHPATLDVLKENGVNVVDQDTVLDGNILTSRGPGTSDKFGVECVRALLGDEKANEIADAMLIKMN